MSTTVKESSEPDALDDAVARLVEDARDARAAAIVYEGASDIESRYADEVATMLATVEVDIDVARTALATRKAGAAAGIHHPMQQLIESTRKWADEMNVQSRLARMEASDRAETISQKAERTAALARHAAGRVSESLEEDLDDLRALALYGIADVRAALDDTVAAIRQSW
jgi:hypothetical protein